MDLEVGGIEDGLGLVNLQSFGFKFNTDLPLAEVIALKDKILCYRFVKKEIQVAGLACM